jgi:hypothetical protein
MSTLCFPEGHRYDRNLTKCCQGDRDDDWTVTNESFKELLSSWWDHIMNKDRYSFLGPRTLVQDIEAALATVRMTWPNAYLEGSTGAERTFYVSVGNATGLVAHCWPRRFREEAMYLRCLSSERRPYLDSDMPDQ